MLDEAAAEAVRQFQEESRSETSPGDPGRGRPRAEIAVDSERGKLQTVLNNLPVAVWVVDADGAVDRR